MIAQRILEITRRGAYERVGVSSSIELFSLLLDPEVIRVDMVWDAALGEKRMTFKSQRRRNQHRLGRETGKVPVLAADERPAGMGSGGESYYDIMPEKVSARG